MTAWSSRLTMVSGNVPVLLPKVTGVATSSTDSRSAVTLVPIVSASRDAPSASLRQWVEPSR